MKLIIVICSLAFFITTINFVNTVVIANSSVTTRQSNVKHKGWRTTTTEAPFPDPDVPVIISHSDLNVSASMFSRVMFVATVGNAQEDKIIWLPGNEFMIVNRGTDNYTNYDFYYYSSKNHGNTFNTTFVIVAAQKKHEESYVLQINGPKTVKTVTFNLHVTDEYYIREPNSVFFPENNMYLNRTELIQVSDTPDATDGPLLSE